MRYVAVALLVAGLASCKRSDPPSPQPGSAGPADAAVAVAVADAGAAPDAGPVYRTSASSYHTAPRFAGTSKTYMVVAEGPDASLAGRAMLASGGNAVDAAVATAFALAVVHPQAGNLGGGGFAVVRERAGKLTALDFREVAPAAATKDMFLDADGKPTTDSLYSHRAAGVPGSVAGLHALHAKYGKKLWREVVAPAIVLARDGFVLTDYMGARLAEVVKHLQKSPASAAIWLPGGSPIAAGSKVTIPDLAATLERIAKHGPKDFYQGETAKLIVAEMERGKGAGDADPRSRSKGAITAADLAAYKVVWRAPIAFGYRGHKVYSMPPPSSGGVVLALTANVLEKIDLGKLGWHSTEHVHWLAETWRRAYAARNELLGDPAFVKNPIAQLTSKQYAAEVHGSITDKAVPSGDVKPLVEGSNTTNLVVVDASGMAVALTTTLNTSFGSGITVAGAGFLLNNEMDDFTVKPGSPNAFGLVQGTLNKIEPGKRMLSSMSPTIVENGKGELVMVLGARGGARIITAVWQSMSNVIDFGLPADAAIAAPRVHHQHLPDQLKLEADSVDEATATALAARGHTLGWGEPPAYFAVASMILKTATGYSGAADPRTDGAVLGD